MMTSGIPIGQWSGSDATDRLRETIERHQAETNRQSAIMLRLTRWMTALTFATVFAAVVQIWLACARCTDHHRQAPPTTVSNDHAHGKLMITVLGDLAELERSLILADGRARTKAKGVRSAVPCDDSPPEAGGRPATR